MGEASSVEALVIVEPKHVWKVGGNRVELLHKRLEGRQQGLSVRDWQDDELDVSPFGGFYDDVAKSWHELRLMSQLELLVGDVQPYEDPLNGRLEMVALEESTKLNCDEL